jgi:general stress protein 26
MNSINRNQPEKNHEDLSGADAVREIRTLIKQAKTCFFCTAAATGPTGGVRPMSVQRVDDDGTIWFLSASDSHQNKEIGIDPNVKLMFQGSAHSDFLFLSGQASISRDKEMIHELWEPILKTWFTQGIDDPRITVIRFTPSEGYYWDTKHGHMVAGVKMMIGAMIGRTLDDSIEGKLFPS